MMIFVGCLVNFVARYRQLTTPQYEFGVAYHLDTDLLLTGCRDHRASLEPPNGC